MATTEYFKKGTAPSSVSDRFARLENVTDLSVTQSDKTLEISWTPVSTPNAINTEYIKAYYDELIKDQETHDKALNSRLEYNTNKMGTIIYNVYVKAPGSEELKFIGSTDNTKMTYNISSSGNYSFTVKTTYTIFKDNASTGASTSFDAVIDVVNVGLSGLEKVVNLAGVPYHESGISVTKNGVDVSSQASYTRVIKDSSSNILSSVPYTQVGTYTIEYIITYQGKTYTKTRTVIYQ